MIWSALALGELMGRMADRILRQVHATQLAIKAQREWQRAARDVGVLSHASESDESMASCPEGSPNSLALPPGAEHDPNARRIASINPFAAPTAMAPAVECAGADAATATRTSVDTGISEDDSADGSSYGTTVPVKHEMMPPLQGGTPLRYNPTRPLIDQQQLAAAVGAIPAVSASEITVRALRLWCQQPALESYLSAKMYRESYELFMGAAMFRLLVVCLVSTSVGAYPLMAELLAFAPVVTFRRWSHHRIEYPQSSLERAQRDVSAVFQVGVLVHSYLSYLFCEHMSTEPPHWLPFCMGAVAMTSCLQHVLVAPSSSASAMARRLLTTLVQVLVDIYISDHLNGHAKLTHIPMSVYGISVLLAYGLERTQRTHALTLMRLEQAESERGSFPKVGRAERLVMEQAFTDLPPLVMRYRVDLDGLQMESELGFGSFGRVRCALWNGPPLRGQAGFIAPGTSHVIRIAASEPRTVRVAVKSIHLCRLRDEGLIRTVLRAAQLELELPLHGNIVTLLGVGWEFESGRIQLVSELCEGGSLGQALEAGSLKEWTAQRKLKLAREIAMGLAFLHEHNVIHRDLKPDNVLLAIDNGLLADPIAKIADFGESRFNSQGVGEMTLGKGTMVFSAPELLSLQSYDSTVDVWALGCVVQCIFTDRSMPYDRFDPAEIMAGRVNPSLVGDGHAADEVVRKCCSLQSSERPSARAMAVMLSRTPR